MRAQESDQIERDLLDESPAGRRHVATGLGRLATWHGCAGELALIDGNLTGWEEIHRAWMYRTLALRVGLGDFERERVLGQFRSRQDLELEARPLAFCLAYALLINDISEIAALGGALRVMLLDRDVIDPSYWNYNVIEPFVYNLLILTNSDYSKSSTTEVKKLGVFQGIIDGWTSPHLLNDAIWNACEFHCQCIADNSDQGREFRNQPFDLVAAEILAVFSIRRRLNLPIPEVRHPLIEKPFDQPLGLSSDLADPLVARIKRAFDL